MNPRRRAWILGKLTDTCDNCRVPAAWAGVPSDWSEMVKAREFLTRNSVILKTMAVTTAVVVLMLVLASALGGVGTDESDQDPRESETSEVFIFPSGALTPNEPGNPRGLWSVYSTMYSNGHDITEGWIPREALAARAGGWGAPGVEWLVDVRYGLSRTPEEGYDIHLEINPPYYNIRLAVDVPDDFVASRYVSFDPTEGNRYFRMALACDTS